MFEHGSCMRLYVWLGKPSTGSYARYQWVGVYGGQESGAQRQLYG